MQTAIEESISGNTNKENVQLFMVHTIVQYKVPSFPTSVDSFDVLTLFSKVTQKKGMPMLHCPWQTQQIISMLTVIVFNASGMFYVFIKEKFRNNSMLTKQLTYLPPRKNFSFCIKTTRE